MAALTEILIILLAGVFSHFVETADELVEIIRKNERNAVKRIRYLIKEDDKVVNKPHEDGTLPLDAAITAENAEIAEILIDNNADINAQFNDGWYALHRVVFHNLEPTLKLLLSKNVDLTKTRKESGGKRNKENGGATCLHDAVSFGRPRMLRTLLKEEKIKAILDAKNEDVDDRTALHEASFLHEPEAGIYAKALLDAGASVGLRDVDGLCPIHYAAIMNNVPLTKLLLHRKALYFVEDKRGERPLEKAIRWDRNDRYVRKILEDAEAGRIPDAEPDIPGIETLEDAKEELKEMEKDEYVGSASGKNFSAKTWEFLKIILNAAVQSAAAD